MQFTIYLISNYVVNILIWVTRLLFISRLKLDFNLRFSLYFRCQLVHSVTWCSVVCVWGWQPTSTSSSLKQRTKHLWRSVRCSPQETLVKVKTSRWEPLTKSGSKRWMGMERWCLQMWTKWTGQRNSCGKKRAVCCVLVLQNTVLRAVRMWCFHLRIILCHWSIYYKITIKVAHMIYTMQHTCPMGYFYDDFVCKSSKSHTIVCVMNRLKILTSIWQKWSLVGNRQHHTSLLDC